jgi:hypothetical protein
MLIVPLQSVPNQSVRIGLNGQQCQINVYQKPRGLFMDLLVDNSPIVAGVICQNLNRIVREAYLGFSGDMAWLDMRGGEDPVYTGIGTRFFLAYLMPDEISD